MPHRQLIVMMVLRWCWCCLVVLVLSHHSLAVASCRKCDNATRHYTMRHDTTRCESHATRFDICDRMRHDAIFRNKPVILSKLNNKYCVMPQIHLSAPKKSPIRCICGMKICLSQEGRNSRLSCNVYIALDALDVGSHARGLDHLAMYYRYSYIGRSYLCT